VSWTNPPAAITQMRTMLLACASVTAAGIVSAKIHYPSAAIESDDATTPDALPICVLAEIAHGRQRYAEGAAGLPSGRISAVLTVDTDAGTLEILARAIADELMLASLSGGLPIRNIDTELCSDPTEGQRAADEDDTGAKHRSIEITVDYGLTV
jgi:hypothetical protein